MDSEQVAALGDMPTLEALVPADPPKDPPPAAPPKTDPPKEEPPKEDPPKDTPKPTLNTVTPEKARAFREKLEAEKAFRERESALKAREAAVARQEELSRLAKEDPLRWLEETGTSVDELTIRALRGERPDPAKKALSEIERLRQEIAERDAREQARMAQEADARRYAEARSYVHDFLAKSEKHELSRVMGAEDMVISTIQKHYAETGEQLSEEAAADAVEAYLESLAEKLLRASKVRAKAAPPAPVTPPKAPEKKAPTTLANADSAEVTTREPEDTLSEDEMIARMASMLRYK